MRALSVITVLTPASTGDATPKSYVDGIDQTAAHLAGAETITGVKTFSATPVISNAPVNATDAVNKAYVDARPSPAPSYATLTKFGVD